METLVSSLVFRELRAFARCQGKYAICDTSTLRADPSKSLSPGQPSTGTGSRLSLGSRNCTKTIRSLTDARWEPELEEK
ncbi:hypothetical protein Y1Q_0009343 [Alligator mississippiensis]|uniref:Uncharacterized protein n=1 Tax=Alligator mississippiensis TaxID=8496 RepID=A0A151N7K4_ALLMI|nr:hypothetical protein Y1Q_0009343 [Alligator mississippiensis]